MARVYSAISKFKRLEAVLREATVRYRKVIEEFDQTLAGPRTQEQIAMLERVRAEVANVFERSREALRHLHDGTEDGKAERRPRNP